MRCRRGCEARGRAKAYPALNVLPPAEKAEQEKRFRSQVVPWPQIMVSGSNGAPGNIRTHTGVCCGPTSGRALYFLESRIPKGVARRDGLKAKIKMVVSGCVGCASSAGDDQPGITGPRHAPDGTERSQTPRESTGRQKEDPGHTPESTAIARPTGPHRNKRSILCAGRETRASWDVVRRPTTPRSLEKASLQCRERRSPSALVARRASASSTRRGTEQDAPDQEQSTPAATGRTPPIT